MRFPIVVALGVSLLLLSSPATASSVIVPDDFPTVQGGIDSGADSVLVRDGIYDEHIVVGRAIELLAIDGFDLRIVASMPRVKSITFVSPLASGKARVRGFTSAGQVVLRNALPGPELAAILERCRLEAGIGQPLLVGQTGTLVVLGCLVLASADVRPLAVQFDDNTFEGGGIRASYQVSGLYRSNDVSAPPDAGIETNGEQDLTVVRNTVRGATDGVLVREPVGSVITDNLLIDCSGTAIRTIQRPPLAMILRRAPRFGPGPVPAGTSVVTIANNTTQGCRGHGIDILSYGGVFVVQKNEIQKAGLSGIHATGSAYMHVENNLVTGPGGAGIWLQADAFGEGVGENLVLGAGGDGMLLEAGTAAFKNVIGRCQGNGIKVFSGDIAGNTCYLNWRSGIQVAGPAGVRNNIGYGNSRFGLETDPGQVQSLGCNDWFANVAGATSGIAPDPSDLAVDPQFCDLPQNRVSLAALSPLLDAPGCGLVGALGLGCNAAIGVPIVSSGETPIFTATPRPARGNVRFAWNGVAARARLEVYDVAGALRWSADIAPPARSLEWSGADAAGRALPAGLYYARIRGPRTLDTPVVIVR